MDFFQADPFTLDQSSVLDRNLAALARTCPQLAARLRLVQPRTDIEFDTSDEGVTTARFVGGTQLASRRRPLSEARTLADSVDVKSHPGIAVLGFGLGHHLEAIAQRQRGSGALLCFEPDLELLRAVFERIDHSDWISATNFAILTEPDDGAAITHALTGVEALVALGVRLVDHPPSIPRLGEQAERFGRCLADVLKALRTTIVTTLVQSETTLRNALMNLDHYVNCQGVADLAGICAGSPAVVVAAGPSLERNLELLADPAVRDRCVIIAVQTVLRTMLARGIRPHFVAALDHHEISKRFYDGLTAKDVEGITLIVEPKANPAILDAFPGNIRCIGEDLLDSILADTDLRHRRMGSIKPGATVAHLCYYFARHLGCDPIILIGQDLGFTDGQYYSAHAAIHNIWASELSEFRTLEMFEWERIARQKSLLRRKVDILGRPIYTDEQMATYLAQFESDFLADSAQGLRVIDATEGGVAKQHTITTTLAAALDACAGAPSHRLPKTEYPARTDSHIELVRRRLVQVRADARTIAMKSRETRRLLRRLTRTGTTLDQINAAVPRIHEIRDEVTALQPAFDLTQFLNQAGSLNRFRADRNIEMEPSLSDIQRQQRRLERDIENVTWIADAADTLCALLEESAVAIAGGTKRTRDLIALPGMNTAPSRRRRVAAILHIDFEQGGLGTPRRLDEPLIAGLSPLAMTVARLLTCRRLKEIVCLTNDEPRLRSILGELHARVVVGPLDLQRFRARINAIGPARRFTPTSWRSGIANLAVFDEALEPASCADIVESRNLDAAIIIGPDWCAIDPALTDALIERHTEHPDGHRITFSQAAPGLCGLLIDRATLRNLADNEHRAGCLATIGAMLGYVPFAPQADPIARSVCINIPSVVRDLQERCIPDSPGDAALLSRAFTDLDPMRASAADLSHAILSRRAMPALPRHITLELVARRAMQGPWAASLARSFGFAPRQPIALEHAQRIIEQLPPASTLTLHGSGDPLDHPSLAEITAAAHKRGLATHLRTALASDTWDQVLDLQCDVVSIDVLATNAPTYQLLTGMGDYERVKERVETLLQTRNSRAPSSLPSPWILPRITRCDAVYEQIEIFYDGWLRACGCAVIDPTPTIDSNGRIAPLPQPQAARDRISRTTITIRSDGSIVGLDNLTTHTQTIASLWQRLHQKTTRDDSALAAA